MADDLLRVGMMGLAEELRELAVRTASRTGDRDALHAAARVLEKQLGTPPRYSGWNDRPASAREVHGRLEALLERLRAADLQVDELVAGQAQGRSRLQVVDSEPDDG